jgi:hypothetical protein
LRHAVVDCLNDSRDRREGDGAQGDEELEGAESNGDCERTFFVGQLMKTVTGRGFPYDKSERAAIAEKSAMRTPLGWPPALK